MKALTVVIALVGLAAAAEQPVWRKSLEPRGEPKTERRVSDGALRTKLRVDLLREESQRAAAAAAVDAPEATKTQEDKVQQDATSQLEREKAFVVDLQRMREAIHNTYREEQHIMRDEAEWAVLREELAQATVMNINTDRLQRQMEAHAQRKRLLAQDRRSQRQRMYERARQTALDAEYDRSDEEDPFLLEDFLFASTSRCFLF
ncbi:hypothetical protein CDD82_5593 [Ophiocordyceps australis]|uniref:Uncharacterized protein n=1 Tax=Ophiocordyceps australis TaxID=1399860 RepID=A0A2C5ZRY9_9HYPO|nr:hypothetical protein CDD82_5593 [Ophiocordyceps australis]